MALMLGLSCELVVNADHLDDRKCPPNWKLCGPHCYPPTDADHGCGNTSCSPCILAHAIAMCDPTTFTCAVRSCVQPWENCDGMPGNGCEIDLAHDPLNCGSCDCADCIPRDCTFMNAAPGCRSKICDIGGCNPGFADCDSDPHTGCETNIWSDSECGTDCNSPACPTGQHCNHGTCM